MYAYSIHSLVLRGRLQDLGYDKGWEDDQVSQSTFSANMKTQVQTLSIQTHYANTFIPSTVGIGDRRVAVACGQLV